MLFVMVRTVVVFSCGYGQVLSKACLQTLPFVFDYKLDLFSAVREEYRSCCSFDCLDGYVDQVQSLEASDGNAVFVVSGGKEGSCILLSRALIQDS